MAGDTPAEAVENFARPLRRVAEIVTPSILFPSGYYLNVGGEPHSLAFSDSPSITLRGTDVTLDFRHRYFVEQTDDEQRGPYKVSSAGYMYSLLAADGSELIAYHWHPGGDSPFTTPHMHLRQHTQPFDLSDEHIATPRISFEHVIRLAIRKFGAEPNTGKYPDWEAMLDEAEGRFETYRTWG